MAVTRSKRGKRPARKPRPPVPGKVTFARPVFSEIAARVLTEVRDVKEVSGDIMSGFLGRLLARGPRHPGIHVDDSVEQISFNVHVVARHGANFYDLGLEIQRRVGERVEHMTGRTCVVNVNVRGVSL